MGFPWNGDLVPTVSGFSNIGVNVSSNGSNAFDITTLRPAGHVHQLSGIFHDPLLGQSGVLRFSQEQAAFQVSVDGGLTFANLGTAGGGVTSVGVIGDANLTGAVDFGTVASGFMVIEDSANASPLLWSVDTLGLSGLWGFPTNGFDTIPTCYSETFTSVSSITATHNLNTQNVIVQVYDNESPPNQVFPDSIALTDADNVTVAFNTTQSGRVVVIACENS